MSAPACFLFVSNLGMETFTLDKSVKSGGGRKIQTDRSSKYRRLKTAQRGWVSLEKCRGGPGWQPRPVNQT